MAQHKEIKLPQGVKSLRDILPYRDYCEDRDIYLNKSSYGFMLEISPLSSNLQKIEDLIHTLSSDFIPQGCNIQILHYASPRVNDVYERWQAGREQNQKITKSRIAYYKSAKNLTIRNYRTFICVSLPDEDKLPELRSYLQRSFDLIDVNSESVKPDEFLNLMHELLYPNSDSPVKWDRNDSLQEQIKNPDYIYDCSNREYIDISNNRGITRVKSYGIREFPEMWNQAQNINLLPDFAHRDRLDCPFIKVYNLTFAKQDHQALKARIKKIRKDASKIDEMKELYYVLDKLSEGQRLVDAFYQVILFSTPKTLDNDEVALRSLYAKEDWMLCDNKFAPMSSWESFLPFAFSEGLYEEFKGLGRLNKHLTSVCANVAPLEGCPKGNEDPYMLLLNKRGTPLFFSPFEDKRGNHNICVVGRAGSGKTLLLKEMATSSMARGDKVILLSGDFDGFSQEVISDGSCMNPFSAIDTDKLDDPSYKFKALQLMGNIITHICYSEGSKIEETYIYESIMWVLDNKGTAGNLKDVGEYLSNLDDARAKNLGSHLLSFVQEHQSYLIGDANIDFESDCTAYDLLRVFGISRANGIMTLLLMFGAFMRASSWDKKTLLIIDEEWGGFSSAGGAKFIENFAQMARSNGLSLVTGAQSMPDMDQSESGTAALKHSEYLLLLPQQSKSMDIFEWNNQIRPEIAEALRSLRMKDMQYSQFIIKRGYDWSLVNLALDPYFIARYKCGNIVLRELQEQGLSLEEALDVQARDIGEKNGSV